MPRRPAALVEPGPQAVTDREWIEPDPLVELDVDPPRDALGRRDHHRQEFLRVDHVDPFETLAPRPHVLLVYEEDGAQSARERPAKPVDDAALDEDAGRQLVGEDEPDAASALI